MNPETPLSLEPPDKEVTDATEKRLWIGNLDNRINEYQLLKMVRAYGHIDKFDLLFHRTGPNVGQPRGFAFVTYKKKEEALRAMDSLNGQCLGSKKIVVKFAKHSNMDEEKPKSELDIPVLTGAKTEPTFSKKTAIQSIEAKLKIMESLQPGDEFVVNKLAATETPIITQFQTKQTTNKQKHTWKRRHPYHKKK